MKNPTCKNPINSLFAAILPVLPHNGRGDAYPIALAIVRTVVERHAHSNSKTLAFEAERVARSTLGRLPATLKSVIRKHCEHLRQDIRDKRNQRSLQRSLPSDPYRTKFDERVRSRASTLARRAYLDAMNNIDGLRATVSIGKPDVVARTVRYRDYATFVHELTIPLSWLSQVHQHRLSIIRVDGDRSFVFNTRWVSDALAYMTYFRVGPTCGVYPPRTAILKHVSDDAWTRTLTRCDHVLIDETCEDKPQKSTSVRIFPSCRLAWVLADEDVLQRDTEPNVLIDNSRFHRILNSEIVDSNV